MIGWLTRWVLRMIRYPWDTAPCKSTARTTSLVVLNDPNYRRVIIHKDQDTTIVTNCFHIEDAYRLAGMTFHRLYVYGPINEDTHQYLMSRVRAIKEPA